MWILVWWVICPHHSQVLHIERDFKDQESCRSYAASTLPSDKPVRWHCSLQ